jgi:molybdenum cofactor cytidylyltransferase
MHRMIAATVLAAGRGVRFGDRSRNKLLEDFAGRPLVLRAVEAALGSRACKTVVVTGWDNERIEAALTGLPITLVHNPDHAEGMASSLRIGVEQSRDASGVLVLLADMPNVTSAILDRLIDAFEQTRAAAVIPVCRGQAGNPALLGNVLFSRLARLTGDIGARHLLRALDDVVKVELQDDGVLTDVDRPHHLDLLRNALGQVR